MLQKLNKSGLRFGTAALALAMAADVVHAVPFGLNTQVTDFNFDNLSDGQALPTTTPLTDPWPQHTVYATGGFPDTGPYTGTNVVGNAGTMNKAAIMTTTQGGIGSNYVDTQFLTSSDRAVVDFDLDIMSAPATGLPQSSTNAPNGQAWIMQAFGLDSNRIFRFVAAPTSATGGVFGLRNNTDGDINVIGNYDYGSTYHIQLYADYSNSTVQAFIDNAPVGTVPFVNAPGNGLEELFIFQNGVEGVTNQVAFDNLVTAVPEPTSLGLLALGSLLLLRRRRRVCR